MSNHKNRSRVGRLCKELELEYFDDSNKEVYRVTVRSRSGARIFEEFDSDWYTFESCKTAWLNKNEFWGYIFNSLADYVIYDY